MPEKWCDIIEYLNGMTYEEPGDFVQINQYLSQICVDENVKLIKIMILNNSKITDR